MPKQPVNSASFDIDRRSFLRGATGLAASAWLPLWTLPDASPNAGSVSPSGIPSIVTPPWWLNLGDRARTVHVQSSRVVDGEIPHAQTLDRLLAEAVMLVSRKASPRDGWRSLLGNAERIACVFSHRRHQDIVTEDAVGRVLVEQLSMAGYAPGSIALVNGPRYLSQSLGCRKASIGWGDGVQLGDDLEQLSRWALDADAIINVPILSADANDGFAGGIGNFARSVIRHPGRYYRSESASLLPTVLAHREISSRLKVTLFNALTVIVDPKSSILSERLVHHGGLLIGQDPVALDTVAYDTLIQIRNRYGLQEVLPSTILSESQKERLGRFQVHEVDDVFEVVR
jgi:hypothetical protein